jgi:hypothetical protein
MADDTKYQGDGFTQGGDNSIFGDLGSDPGSISDYDTWDWKQIEAAINGMSAGVDNSANNEHAASVSSPDSLLKAAQAFAYAQNTFTIVAKALSDQANALAGTDGPWQGDAAEAFFDMINTFSKQVQANADVLSGGATGSHSVPQQLADNSVNLANAQKLIREIDTWYANQALKDGVKPMANGLIPISYAKHADELISMMTSDMRKVLKSLASNYQVTIDNIRAPTPINGPLGDAPPTDAPPLTDPPDTGDLGADGLDAGGPDAGGLDTGGPDAGGLDTGGPDAGDPQPFDGPTSTDGPGGDLAAAGPDGFPDSLDTGGPSDVPAFDPNALDAAINPDGGTPSPFPDGTDTGLPDGADPQDFAAVPPTAFPNSTSTNGGTDLPSTGLPNDSSAFDDAGLPEDFPGDTGLGGSDGLSDTGLPNTGLADTGTPQGFPGDLGLESGGPQSDLGLPNADDTATGFPTGTDLATGEPGGMPFMPPGGMGAPGTGTTPQSTTDPSDASGLLDSNTEERKSDE